MRFLLLLLLCCAISSAEKYYEYDGEGFLVGWHEDANRPNSTQINFAPIKPAHARFVNGAWTDDNSRVLARESDQNTERTKIQQAKLFLRNYDPGTAMAADVKQAIKSITILLHDMTKENL